MELDDWEGTGGTPVSSRSKPREVREMAADIGPKCLICLFDGLHPFSLICVRLFKVKVCLSAVLGGGSRLCLRPRALCE